MNQLKVMNWMKMRKEWETLRNIKGGYPVEKPGQTFPTPLSKHGASRQITGQTSVLKKHIWRQTKYMSTPIISLYKQWLSGLIVCLACGIIKKPKSISQRALLTNQWTNCLIWR